MNMILKEYNKEYGGFHKLLSERTKSCKIVRIYKGDRKGPPSKEEFTLANIKVSICFSLTDKRSIEDLQFVLFREFDTQLKISKEIEKDLKKNKYENPVTDGKSDRVSKRNVFSYRRYTR
jgi:hypothetical protein